jgi:S-formylglutathione hydrolase FrmB
MLALALLAAVLACAALTAGALRAGPDPRGAQVVRFTVHSRLLGRGLDEVGVVPAGVSATDRRPLLVFLHGRGGQPDDLLSDQFYAGLAALGPRAPIVVALYGGDHSYWHDRRDGRWGSYVLSEAIPQAVRSLHADPGRVAIGGISMGGFGAFDLARRARGRFCAVGGHSPAFWLSAGATAPGAFDGGADFARHDLYSFVRAHRRPFGSAPLWIDRGDQDPFTGADAQIVHALRASGATLTAREWPGAHVGAYWRSHMAQYLRFYAGALARCR